MTVLGCEAGGAAQLLRGDSMAGAQCWGQLASRQLFSHRSVPQSRPLGMETLIEPSAQGEE
jgi:hypothetical protein